MKKLISLLLILTVCLRGANVQIRDLATTISLSSSNTYLIADGATQNTVKFLLASLPVITSTRTTLAALSVTNISTGVAVQTLGGAAVADGNAGLYYYNSASAATPNGTTIIQPAVGSGRWLIVSSSALPTPTTTTLGGVFSIAPATNYFLTSVGTDGTVTAAIPSLSNISGAGTMASQNANAVAITGGTIAGMTSIAGTTITISGNSYMGNLVLKSGQVNESATNALSSVDINFDGYNGGTTQFRNVNIYDGKNALVATFTGSTKALNVIGALSAASASFTTALPLASGGTAATSASGARTSLGVTATGADTTYNFRANNLSDVASASTARTNLGVTGTGADTTYAFRANNLSDLASASTARTNLGLGTMATQASGAVAITGGTFSGGVFNGSLGSVTPSTAIVTTLSSNSAANIRTTKGNFNLAVNVKDYGATGNGSTDDSAAINSAIGALTSRGTLYFPPGKYRFTSGLAAFNSLSYITVTGDGAELYNDTGAAGGNTFVFDSSCSNVEVYGLSFTGSSSVRGNGIHIRMYASNASIHDNYLQGCSDFAIHVSNSGAAYSSNVSVTDNIINGPLGDGIHVGAARDVTVANNTISNTGDDGIGIIADTASLPPMRINVTGNSIYNSASAGIRINEVLDVLVSGNNINTTVAAGIELNRYLSTTAYNYRVTIKGNRLYNTVTTVGPRGSIWMNFCVVSTVEDNDVLYPATGAAIVLLDFSQMVVKGNYIFASQVRSIAFDDSSTTNVAATWNDVMITNNIIGYNAANEAIYLVPATGRTVNRITVTGNIGQSLPAGNWIYYDRIATGKVGNNVSTAGAAISGGGSVTGVTLFNNN